MSRPGSEADLEAAALELLADLGWETIDAMDEKPGDLGRQDSSELYSKNGSLMPYVV